MFYINNLFDFTVKTIDNYRAEINNIYFTFPEWKIAFFKIDFGGILTSDFSMVSVGHIRELNSEKKAILLEITKKMTSEIPTYEDIGENTTNNQEKYFNYNEMKGFSIKHNLEQLGVLKDFIVDNSWIIKHIVADTNGMLPFGNISIPANCLIDINTLKREITSSLSIEELNKIKDKNKEPQAQKLYK